MSQINVNRIKDSNKGAPDFPSGVNVGGITSTVTLGVTNLTATNVNVSGVVTATTLDGNLLATGTPTLGLGVTINTSGVNISGVATAGIVSATTLYGDGTNLTGIALTIAALNYNPAFNSQASHLTKASGIGLTFNQGVKAGSGNVTLSLANAGVAGTVVENFGVGNSVSYSGDSITITPTADLTAEQDYHLSYPSGAFTNIGGDLSSVGIAYTFKGRSYTYEVWQWGRQILGKFGFDNNTKYSSPVQLPGTDWVQAYTGVNSNYWLKNNGTLWAAGRNDFGQLGQNSTGPANTGISSPVQISGTTWAIEDRKFSSGTYNGFHGIKTDGTLWGWASGNQGHGGWLDIIARSSPTQIPGTTWSKLATSGGLYSGLCQGAIKTDGTLWVWGYNDYGGLGQNNTVSYSSPVQVPGTTWNEVGTNGYNEYIASKTDGTLWSWGLNEEGQLGHNSTTIYSSPIQIPGTDWYLARGGDRATSAIKRI